MSRLQLPILWQRTPSRMACASDGIKQGSYKINPRGKDVLFGITGPHEGHHINTQWHSPVRSPFYTCTSQIWEQQKLGNAKVSHMVCQTRYMWLISYLAELKGQGWWASSSSSHVYYHLQMDCTYPRYNRRHYTGVLHYKLNFLSLLPGKGQE